MLTFDETISTLQSSFQTIYGLIIGFMAVLSDLKEGKQIITSPDLPSSSTQQSSSSSSSSATVDQQIASTSSSPILGNEDQSDDCDLNCYVDTDNEKGRVVIILKNVLALWHLVVNLLYLVKRAVAVKVHIADPEKIVINPERVKKLTYRFHNKFLK